MHTRMTLTLLNMENNQSCSRHGATPPHFAAGFRQAFLIFNFLISFHFLIDWAKVKHAFCTIHISFALDTMSHCTRGNQAPSVLRHRHTNTVKRDA